MNKDRAEHVKQLFQQPETGYRAIICRLPQNVLLFTGYQPILGNSFCLLSLNQAQELEVRLAVPADEQDLVPPDAALEVKTFAVETWHDGDTTHRMHTVLGELLRSAGVTDRMIVGYEGGYIPLATGSPQMSVPKPATLDLLHALLIGDSLRDATVLLDELASLKTEEELKAIRRCEFVARQGFEAARTAIYVGSTEAEIVTATTAGLLWGGYAIHGVKHVQPYVHVMAGPRAAHAYRTVNLTDTTSIADGDPVLVQIEIGINGYWAELTRTFFAQSISREWQRAHRACVVAQNAALKAICEGVLARDVDQVARQVMHQAGFGAAFKHGLGHGIGFQAINYATAPALHPASKAVLRSGMIHTIEPAVYLEEKGGFRLNDNVVVHPDGNEVLSSALPRDLDWLVVER